MQQHQHLQINVGHLKTEIVKKLGAERSKLYFFYLYRFLSLKVTKVEFNKICSRVLGRENIVLHNQLITSILRNAYHAKAPPEIHGSDAADECGDFNISVQSDEFQQTSTCRDQPHTFNSSLLSNGSIFQPRLRATGTFSTPDGVKADIFSSHSKETATVLENGSAIHSSIDKPTHQHQLLPEGTGNRGEVKFPDIQDSQDEQSRVCNDSKFTSSEDWTGASIRRSLQAPLGVPLSAVTTGGARRAVSSYEYGGLLDSVTLKHSMEQIAMSEGLQDVSLDCANLLNSALDSYLKCLIRPSIEMAGNGSGSDPQLNMTYKAPMHSSLGNRFLSSNQPQITSSSRTMDIMLQEQRPLKKVSLLDFRVAMELKPQQLGEDWPLLLEKMNAHSHTD